MRRSCSIILTLVAWLFATGSHWDVVQTFAWGNMIATYSSSMPLLSAVEKTFSAGASCDICQVVDTAKKPESTDATLPQGTVKTSGKIYLCFSPAASLLVISPLVSSWSPNDHALLTTDRAAPPLPPPRALS